MNKRQVILVALVCAFCVEGLSQSNRPKKDAIRVVQLLKNDAVYRRYPDSLPSLLKHVNEKSTARFDPDPLYVSRLDDKALTEQSMLYVNCDDQPNLEFDEAERRALRMFLERGGFLYLDAGIKASFLGSDLGHSYAAWEARPEIDALFKQLFPDNVLLPLPRNHELFRCFYKGLPDSADLRIASEQKKVPENVLRFVEEEKWPQGTYSFIGLHLNDRIAVLASPICAMGWGKDEFGNWLPPISFRIRETAEGLDKNLKLAAFEGSTYEVTREDGLKDIVYTQLGIRPVWVEEPNKKWRIFKYYSGEDISNYAHAFYTRLGTNVFLYALTQ
jgi:hypothetical protein